MGHCPLFMLTYGVPKVGKTLASLRAFSSGVFVGPPQCFLPAKEFLGIEVKTVVVNKISDLFPIVAAARKKPPVSLVISDMTILSSEEVIHIRDVERITGWDVYAAYESRMKRLVRELREISCPILLEFHQDPPKVQKKNTASVKKETFLEGRPKVPGWVMPEELPGYFDAVLQVISDESMLSSFVWGYGFSSRPDGTFVRGDRTALFPPVFPLNIREVLRCSNLHTPMHPDAAWIEEKVDSLASRLVELQTNDEFDSEHLAPLLEGVVRAFSDKHPGHVQWLILDAFDRAELHKFRESRLTNLVANLLKKVEES